MYKRREITIKDRKGASCEQYFSFAWKCKKNLKVLIIKLTVLKRLKFRAGAANGGESMNV